MGQVDCVHCRHRLVYEKQRRWGQAGMSSHQLGTEAGGTIKWRRESVQKPTSSPVAQIHFLSANCAVWLPLRRSSGPENQSDSWGCCHPAPILLQCLGKLWRLKEEVPNSAWASRSLIGHVGPPPASRDIWDNLVLIKNHLGNLLKVQIPWSPSHLTLW